MPTDSIPNAFPDQPRLAMRGGSSADILILAGFVRSLDWAESLWVPDLARTLAARGHKVEVVLDGCDLPRCSATCP